MYPHCRKPRKLHKIHLKQRSKLAHGQDGKITWTKDEQRQVEERMRFCAFLPMLSNVGAKWIQQCETFTIFHNEFACSFQIALPPNQLPMVTQLVYNPMNYRYTMIYLP